MRRSITSSKERCLVACAGPPSDVSCAEPELGGEYGAFRLSIPAYHVLEEEIMYTSLTSSEGHVQRSNRYEARTNNDLHELELLGIVGS